MSEWAQTIYAWVLQGVGVVGGIGSVIAIITTIIKTFGGNSIKTKLAANRVELDKTLADGLNGIQERVNTDITVNISAQVNEAVERATRALNEQVDIMREELHTMREGIATILEYDAERQKRLKQDADYLIEEAAKMRAVEQIERAKPVVAHVSTVSAEVGAENKKSDSRKVVI